MKAWIVPVNPDGTENMTFGVTNEYKSERTLLQYGAPKKGDWNLHVHYDWSNCYKTADKIIQIRRGVPLR